MGKHALLSPSGTKRWLACKPSARLESKLPDSSSDFADEGTLAHTLSELFINYALHRISKKDYEIELKVLRSRKYYSLSMHSYCDEYKTYVIEKYNQCRVKDPNAIILLETRLNLTAFIPEGFGTADIIIVCNGLLILIDLKYGQGVAVDCEDNEQLKVYGLGAVHRYDAFFEIDIVELHIYQPRIDNVGSWQISRKALDKWAVDELIPGANDAFQGVGEFVPGDHCRFCRAKPQCAALKTYVDEAFQPNKVPGLITPAEVAQVLEKAPVITNWLNSISEYALKQALEKGTRWPGFKLVEGISRRIIKDDEAAIEILKENDFEEYQYLKSDLRSLGDLEKLVGKKKFETLFQKVIHKPVGKPTLVPVTDKRKAMGNAEDVFSGIVFEDEEPDQNLWADVPDDDDPFA